MKKIILLGGSAQQIVAINAAKKRGYYTILCDYLVDNPGQYVADKYYPISTTDKEAVLKVAIDEKIDGIVAYSSDPAAPTAAYVARELRLPGVPYEIAEAFCNKNLFRKFLYENKFNVPGFIEINRESDASSVADLIYPLIVKPSDSSGSKGVKVIYQQNEFDDALEFADNYSRNHILIAEEFIERNHKDVIETEIYVIDGCVKIWGIMSSIRDNLTNPLIPAAYCYPASIPDVFFDIVKKEVSRLVKASGVINGAFNIEMVINNEGKLYFLDAGPRNGGNELPEYISMICNMDIPSITVSYVMNDAEKPEIKFWDGKDGGNWGLYVIHADKSGILKGIEYSDMAKGCLIKEHLFKPLGSKVCSFTNSRDAIGLAFFKFPNKEIQSKVLRDFTGKHIKLIIQ